MKTSHERSVFESRDGSVAAESRRRWSMLETIRDVVRRTGPLANPRTHPLVYVLAGGLIAGALDILYAYTFWTVKSQMPAQRIFQSVATGLLGDTSFQGGWRTAALGVALHFVISITIAVVYYLLALRWSLLWQQPLLSGTIYGLLVYGAMNYVVLPMSAAGSVSRNPLWVGLSILVHMFLIGVPLAVFGRRAVLADNSRHEPGELCQRHEPGNAGLREG